MGAYGESEDCAIIAAVQAVGAGFLHVGPTDRELCGALDLVVDDRPLADRRADHLVTGGAKRANQRVEPVMPDDYRAARRIRPLSVHRHLPSRLHHRADLATGKMRYRRRD